MRHLVLGIDVGGTNIKMGIVNRSGRIIARSTLNTKSYIRDKKKLISAIVAGIRKLFLTHRLKAKDFIGIGMGLPGLVDPVKGMVIFLPNIPGWKNVPLKSILQKHLRIPTFIDNDVNLITLGEWRFGAGKGVQNLLCMTLGTGVGGGLIFNNQLYRGEGFAAGELGHMPLNERGAHCNCGGYGCFEVSVGNQHLEKKAKKIFKSKPTLEEITALAKRGNKKAVRFWEEAATHIGNALTGVVNLLNPTRIIIGGGVSNCPLFLFKTINKTIQRRAMKVQSAMVKVVKAKLGNDAGILGARVLVCEAVNRK